ncbi:MAG TPA: DNA polymerase III subunit delta' [Acidobacteriota bacterium]|nr:DNA polymerase III subunit delta' [Acidobacteriota bacterium]
MNKPAEAEASATRRLGDFVGNRELLRLLSGRNFPQASIFHGPAGVGKRTLALLLAARFNCRGPSAQELCGRCSSCVKAASGNHPDIRIYQTEKSSLRVDLMREMNQEVQFRPFEGRLRFFLIDEAEKLTEEAANSILKTLEEPPETSRIILITPFPDQLLATIRSRCQSFRFAPLNREEVLSYLNGRGDLDDREFRAAYSLGSIGRALSLPVETTRERRDRMLDLLAAWLKRPAFETVLRRTEKDAPLKTRPGVLEALFLLRLIGCDLYFLQARTPERVVNSDKMEQLNALTAGLSIPWLRDFLQALSRAETDVQKNVNPLLCFETLWLELTSPAEGGATQQAGIAFEIRARGSK